MNNKWLLALLLTSGINSAALAEEISMNTAQMQAMDKITGRVSIIEVPVGGEVKFGSFSVVVRACKTRPEEEIPENFAFVDVTDKSFDMEEFNIFKGWMLSSSPAVHAVEHPIYDVWLLKCLNTNVKAEQLLSETQLSERDNLPRLQEIKTRNESLKEHTLADPAENIQNIYIKETMYKELPPQKQQEEPAVKKSGEPQNLLNIPTETLYSEPDPTEDLLETEPQTDDLSLEIEAELKNRNNSF